MKYQIPILILALIALLTMHSCQSPNKVVSAGEDKQDSLLFISDTDANVLEITAIKGASFNHPTMAIWLETPAGQYIKTLFITQAYASGIYGHAQLTDSTWSNKSGASYQPAALPYWSFKKGRIDGEHLVPTKDHPYLDAHTAATPLNSFILKCGTSDIAETTIVLLEINQAWDWNEYWTNNKFPKDIYYKGSAQPSIIYAATIEPETHKTYHLKPVGHGHYSGADGVLYPDLSTLTTAKNIFETITITLHKK